MSRQDPLILRFSGKLTLVSSRVKLTASGEWMLWRGEGNTVSKAAACSLSPWGEDRGEGVFRW